MMSNAGFNQSPFDVRLEWGLAAAEHLAHEADCVVIVDVMSFSTCVSLANDNDALIDPRSWKDDSAVSGAGCQPPRLPVAG